MRIILLQLSLVPVDPLTIQTSALKLNKVTGKIPVISGRPCNMWYALGTHLKNIHVR